MSRLRVCVIFGGRSGEHEISLRSARSVLEALDPAKYDVLPVGITHDGRWFAGDDVLDAFEKRTTDGLVPVTFPSQPGRRELIPLGAGGRIEDLSFDLAYPVLHGTYGEDGTIQGLFEMADVPYVGAGVLASSVGMDKVLFKLVMQRCGLPVVDGGVVLRTQILERRRCGAPGGRGRERLPAVRQAGQPRFVGRRQQVPQPVVALRGADGRGAL